MLVEGSMQLNIVTIPRYRVVRGFGRLVRVDISKAQEAMKFAMEKREDRRSSDEGRNQLTGSHAT